MSEEEDKGEEEAPDTSNLIQSAANAANCEETASFTTAIPRHCESLQQIAVGQDSLNPSNYFGKSTSATPVALQDDDSNNTYVSGPANQLTLQI